MSTSGSRKTIRDSRLRLRFQEIWELGARRTLFRVKWELQTRLALRGRGPLRPLSREDDWTGRLPFPDASSVADAMRDRIPEPMLVALRREADHAARGVIRCFGAQDVDYGNPPDWLTEPRSGQRWDGLTFWSRAFSHPGQADIKLLWEIARFPHAYAMARAAAFYPDQRERLRTALAGQMRALAHAAPARRGPHWASAQELAIRHFAWLFAMDTLLYDDPESLNGLVAKSLSDAAQHTSNVIEYAQKAVYNNHLLAEALCLYVAGATLPNQPEATIQRETGLSILADQAGAQFYGDGGYILLSLNYQRAALQLLLYAATVMRGVGQDVPEALLSAVNRSVDFMISHQNPRDGRMPNVGPNDGSLPCPLSTCEILDFRPTLQAAAILARGERVYPPGPWDEESAWWHGPGALDLPLREPRRRSRSFPTTGFHVLRSPSDPNTFATFRCGTLLDRFGQNDMLHVDIWWRGHNVAVDAGTFMYAAPAEWIDYFDGTGGHSTMRVCHAEQMIRVGQFKHVFPTEARLLEWRPGEDELVSGEQYGYRRRFGVIHRRTVRLTPDERVVVRDELRGPAGARCHVSLQWLLGDFPFRQEHEGLSSVVLDTPGGAWRLEVRSAAGNLLPASIVTGQLTPPRGWLARHYGTRIPTPSLLVEGYGLTELTTTARAECG